MKDEFRELEKFQANRQLTEMDTVVASLEKERDFYFSKLRSIEVGILITFKIVVEKRTGIWIFEKKQVGIWERIEVKPDCIIFLGVCIPVLEDRDKNCFESFWKHRSFQIMCQESETIGNVEVNRILEVRYFEGLQQLPYFSDSVRNWRRFRSSWGRWSAVKWAG